MKYATDYYSSSSSSCSEDSSDSITIIASNSKSQNDATITTTTELLPLSRQPRSLSGPSITFQIHNQRSSVSSSSPSSSPTRIVKTKQKNRSRRRPRRKETTTTTLATWNDARPPTRPQRRPADRTADERMTSRDRRISAIASPYVATSALRDIDDHAELKETALACIRNREALIDRVKVASFRRRDDDDDDAIVVDGEDYDARDRLRRLIDGLRDASLCTVEAIVEWKRGCIWGDDDGDDDDVAEDYDCYYGDGTSPLRSPKKKRSRNDDGGSALSSKSSLSSLESSSTSSQMCFRWKGENYLLKMLRDVTFISNSPVAMEIIFGTTGEDVVVESSLKRNPFLLPFDMEDILGCKPPSARVVDYSRHSTTGACKSFRKIRKKVSEIVDFNRVKEACMSLLCEEHQFKSALNDNNTAGDDNDTTNERTTRRPKMPLSKNDDGSIFPLPFFRRFPPPHVDRKELEHFSSMPMPPIDVAVVVSCLRLLLGCDGNESLIRQNIIPPLTQKRAWGMLRRPVKQMLDKLKAFDADDVAVSENVLRILYPIVNHGDFRPDVMERRASSTTIGNLARWLKEVILDQVDDTDLLERSRGFMLADPPIFSKSVQSMGGGGGRSSMVSIEEEAAEEEDGEETTPKKKKTPNKAKRKKKRKRKRKRRHSWDFSQNKYDKSQHDGDDIEITAANEKSESWDILASGNKVVDENDAPRNNHDSFSNFSKRGQLKILQFDKWSSSLKGKFSLDADETLKPPTTMVPIPLPCSVTVVEGSPVVTICKGTWDDKGLKEGDGLRIRRAHESLDYIISSEPSRTELILTNAYHHVEETKDDDGRYLRPCSPNTQKRMRQSIVGTSGVPCSPSKKGFNQAQQENSRDKNENENQLSVKATKYDNVRVWKLIPESDDHRHLWRKEYDDGNVPWTDDFSDSSCGYAHHFSVKIKWKSVEECCRDATYSPETSIHEQRVNYFKKVPLSDIVEETFRCVCQWNPSGSGVDNVKWSRLARKFKYLSTVRNTNHEVDMAFVRQSRNVQRKLDVEKFTSMLTDVATMQHPELRDRTTALAELLWTSVVALPSVNRMVWDKAKRLAIAAEGRRSCAQIRLASLHRRTHRESHYRAARRAATVVAKHARRWIAHRRRRTLVRRLDDDRRFRCRHVAAVICQKYFRRFRCERDGRRRDERKWREELETLADYRRRMRRQRERRRLVVVFREIRRVQTTVTAVVMSLKENRPLSRECSLEIRAYVPTTQETFRFALEEDVFRDCTEEALKSRGRLSWNEMLDKTALRRLADRLMVRVVGNRPIILFSRRSINERGLLVAKTSARLNDMIFVVFVYRSLFDVVLSTYDPKTCRQLRTCVSMTKLTEWLIKYEEKQKHDLLREMKTKLRNNKSSSSSSLDDADNSFCSSATTLSKNCDGDEQPMLLRNDKEKELVTWLMKRLRIKERHSSSTGTGVFEIQLECEAEEEKQEFIASKIQSIWRKLMAIRQARKRIRRDYEKAYDRERQMYYYTNIKTGMRQYEKPSVLGTEDLTDPKDEWREFVVEDINDTTRQKQQRTYYFNPATGQITWLSETDAAILLQRKFRTRQSVALLESKITLLQLAKAVKFVRDTERNYQRESSKLSHKFNYAMLLHTLRFDFDAARPLYKEAFASHPTHPVISRAYAIFVLASCESPRLKCIERARGLFVEAEGVDPHREKFDVAREAFFKWSVVAHPDHPTALLNYALLHQCVLKDYGRAEKLYRRALAAAAAAANSGDDVQRQRQQQCVVTNYEFFEEQRYPGGLYYVKGSGPSYSVLRRSQVVDERPEWGEWKKMMDVEHRRRRSSSGRCANDDDDDDDDASFGTFWYNVLEKRTSFVEPDWKEVWDRRVERSTTETTTTTKENGSDGNNNNSSSSRGVMWVEYWDEMLGERFFYNRTTEEYVPDLRSWRDG